MRLPFLKRTTPDEIVEIQSDWFAMTMQDWPGWYGMAPQTAERVWVANRCMQLNSQQVASMPLQFSSTAPQGGFEPAWVTSPDPAWYPNGIGDAVFAAIWSMYAYGDAFLYVTARYANMYPSAWTVLDPRYVVVDSENGRRVYRSHEEPLDPDSMVQVTRDPRGGLRGTSALQAYAPSVRGLMAGVASSAQMAENPIPTTVLKSEQKLTKEQATDLQDQWVERAGMRRGAPAILPPKLDFSVLAFSPKDLLLLEAQQWDAKVIATAYGVPINMLNMNPEGRASLTYTNVAMLGEYWWRFELRPTALRLSRALSEQMLPRGSQVDFDATDTFSPLAQPLEQDSLATPPADGADAGGDVVPLRPTTMEGF